VAQLPDELFDGIRELSSIVISDETLPTALDRVVNLTNRVLPGADAVGITMIKGERISKREYEVETAAYSGDRVIPIDEAQYAAGEGPCLQAIKDSKAFAIDDLEKDDRWPDFRKGALAEGLRSSLSLPLLVGGRALGALNIYSFEKSSFDEQDVELGRTFAAQAAVALANVQVYEGAKALADNLTKAMESRAVIEQAKGMIMMQRGCSEDEAFQTLVAASQARNQKLRDIAQELVQQAEQGKYEDPAH
jgi:GAF domain-containing protein